jgi:polyhydroxyalkanoate synthase
MAEKIMAEGTMAKASMPEGERRDGPHRQGPRPLPLHLATVMGSWLGSRGALSLSRSGSPPWSAALSPQHEAIERALAGVNPEALAEAIDREGRRRLGLFLDGVTAYRHHPYRRDLPDAPVIWREGTTRLVDYGGEGVPALVVPSLINRAYILDLSAERSLLRAWPKMGVRPLLVDWDRPGPLERGFDLTAYIAGRLEAALDATLALTGRPPVVVGYCMGGLLALALAIRRHRDIAGLVLLATPWDFHAERAAQARLLAATAGPLAPLIGALGELPVDLLQALFAGIDPFQVPRKFQAFARLDAGSPRARAFVALEDWLNDGVPLAGSVAIECLVGWYGHNLPGRDQWRVAGEPVVPAGLGRPTLVVLPAGDRIVPPASASALAAAIPAAERLDPEAGHIGMIVGGSAEALVWRPVAAWIAACGGERGERVQAKPRRGKRRASARRG